MNELKPISGGVLVLVGVKASNFSDDIKNHPQVVMWDSQNQHWEGKPLPVNTRAVFITRFIGHAAFSQILLEARKRQITVFNQEGTGVIAKQVRELLGMNKDEVTEVTEEPVAMSNDNLRNQKYGKLFPLRSHINWNKADTVSVIAAAHELMDTARQKGIDTTVGSLSMFIRQERRKNQGLTPYRSGGSRRKRTTPKFKPEAEVQGQDVSVEMLDEAIKQMKDIRNYLAETVKENNTLKARIERMKKAFDA